MRSLLLIVLASVVLGGSAGASFASQGRIVDLLAGIFQDIDAIANSFTGGPDDPRSPVSNSAVLSQDRAYLDAATAKARQLASELQRLQTSSADRDH